MRKERQPTTWAPVIAQLLHRAEAEAERWGQAARTRYAIDSKDKSEAMQQISHRANVARGAAKDLTIAFDLEKLGRDVSNLTNEILSCFQPKGAHSAETIAKRLFDDRHVAWTHEHFVERYLQNLADKGRLYTRHHERTYKTLYMLATPERIAERQAAKVAKAKRDAEAKILEARQGAVLAMLHELGCESAETDRYEEKIQMSLEDAERLLTIAPRLKQSA